MIPADSGAAAPSRMSDASNRRLQDTHKVVTDQ